MSEIRRIKCGNGNCYIILDSRKRDEVKLSTA